MPGFLEILVTGLKKFFGLGPLLSGWSDPGPHCFAVTLEPQGLNQTFTKIINSVYEVVSNISKRGIFLLNLLCIHRHNHLLDDFLFLLPFINSLSKLSLIHVADSGNAKISGHGLQVRLIVISRINYFRLVFNLFSFNFFSFNFFSFQPVIKVFCFFNSSLINC